MDQGIAYALASLAAVTYLAKSVYELVRARRDERSEGGVNGDGSARIALAVAGVLEKHAEREERVLQRLLDLQNAESITLARIELTLDRLAGGFERLAEIRAEESRILNERIDHLARRLDGGKLQ